MIAKDCDYGTDTDNQIGDEILQKCISDYLRRKLLEEGQGLTLARTLELKKSTPKWPLCRFIQPNTTAAMTTQSTELPQLPTVVISVLEIRVSPARYHTRKVHVIDVATQATIVEIQPAQLAARPVATVVVPITLLPYVNQTRVPPAECILSTRCQV